MDFKIATLVYIIVTELIQQTNIINLISEIK